MDKSGVLPGLPSTPHGEMRSANPTAEIEMPKSQFEKLTTALERLDVAVEALKEPQTSDKTAAFWGAYKTLADDFDKEFLHKYGNDLDTSLIFAGLFSAVISAFITQIQPELQPDPNATTEALLLLLVKNVTGITPPAAQQAAPTTIIVAAQGLLYLSLFCTLFSALLATLGKQWLLYYSSAGERGTIEDRGLERQRKFDGLQRWKFDLVLQTSPLLLQFALMLFAVALAIYLWTINHAIAAIVFGLTVLGFILYALMLISAAASPDSPFQTPLTTFVMKRAILPQPLRRLAQGIRRIVYHFSLLQSTVSQAWPKTRLPLFHITKSPRVVSSQPVAVFKLQPPAKEVSAVIWALETTTDPKVVETVAAIVPDLQWWPVDFDLHPSLRRLSDVFKGCFDDRTLRNGMGDRATSCIKAFGVLRMVSGQPKGLPDLWTPRSGIIHNGDAELTSLVRFFPFVRSMDCFWTPIRVIRPFTRLRRGRSFGIPPSLTHWTLRFISAQRLPEKYLKTLLANFHPDEASHSDRILFADFLFCVNSFFALPAVCDISVLDKSKYCVVLTKLLFESLAKRLGDVLPLDSGVAIAIAQRAAQFAAHIEDYSAGEDDNCRNSVYLFCAAAIVPREAVRVALRIVRLSRIQAEWIHPSHVAANVTWVYDALEELYASRTHEDTAGTIGDFLQVLCHSRPIRTMPSSTALRVILWALRPETFDGDSSLTEETTSRLRTLAFPILCEAETWFLDDELQRVLRANDVWASLGAFIREQGSSYELYINLGTKLSGVPLWRDAMRQDLPGWLQILPQWLGLAVNEAEEVEEAMETYRSILARVWSVNEDDAAQFEGEEKTLFMAFGALGTVWDDFDFADAAGVNRVAYLLQCTMTTAFYTRLDPLLHYTRKIRDPSQRFKEVAVLRLGDALVRAGLRAGLLSDTCVLLTKVASTISGPLRDGWPNAMENGGEREAEVDYWQTLESRMVHELEASNLGGVQHV